MIVWMILHEARRCFEVGLCMSRVIVGPDLPESRGVLLCTSTSGIFHLCLLSLDKHLIIFP